MDEKEFRNNKYLKNIANGLKFYFNKILNKKFDNFDIEYESEDKDYDTLDDDEFKLMLKHAGTDQKTLEFERNQLMLKILRFTGIRNTSLRTIKISYVNKPRDEFCLYKAKGRKNKLLYGYFGEYLCKKMIAYTDKRKEPKQEYLFYSRKNPTKPLTRR